MKTSNPPIVVTQTFNTVQEDLWSAITDVDRMTKWFFDDIPEFKAEVGFKTEFVIYVEDRIYTHMWTITDVEPGRSITYRWEYLEHIGVGKVVMSLSLNPLTLTLTNTVEEDFPDDVPEFNRESCIGGWEYFIKERLKQYIDVLND